MKRKLRPIRDYRNVSFILFMAIMIILAACSPGEPEHQVANVTEPVEVETEADRIIEVEPAVESESMAEASQERSTVDIAMPTLQTADDSPVPVGTPAPAAGERSNSPSPHISRPYDRLIIKNAEIGLLVEDTDTAINRAIGIVVEYDGYIVNNRTWFDEKQESPQTRYKNATLTIGVPVENFEEMLRRFKDLAAVVTNEIVTGQDVSDQYVDLESRLVNLESTARRIRDFLEEANDVDKALEVSNKLTEVEAEIEQVKGRMNYLKDRSAFSTITLEIRPQMPTPTPTPTATATATPTATPAWSAGQTFGQASGFATTIATSAFQVTIDLLIWGLLVVLPCLAPILLVIWLGHRLTRRFLTVK